MTMYLSPGSAAERARLLRLQLQRAVIPGPFQVFNKDAREQMRKIINSSNSNLRMKGGTIGDVSGISLLRIKLW
jgi:hypothetical protein